MQVHRHYSKAPITEAIIDLKVAFPEGFTVDQLADIYASISNRFPTSEALPGLSPPTIIAIKRLARETLWNTITKIYHLLTWDNGWNGYDSCAPGYDAVIYADQWIVQMFLEAIALDSIWIEPNVTASEEGEVVFEWWYGTKKLTIYIGNQSAEYVKVWGTAINSDMSDGDASPISTCRSLWEWLTCR